ncbi:MAG: glucokinase [Minwuia thermotolerans]|nr:MAG: glucokinase [Minwuia thermotolerans]
MRLIADIGGTHARFGIVDGQGTLSRVRKLRTADHVSFTEAARSYLSANGLPNVTSVAVAIAGPVSGGTGRLVNGPWHFDLATLRDPADGGKVRLLNDLQAAALGTRHCDPVPLAGDCLPDHQRPVLTIGVGTGIGGSLLVPDRSGDQITVATEIGHGLLSTRGLLETDVPFSAEALLSGTGLPQLCRIAGFREGTGSAPEIIEFLRQATPSALRLGQLYAHLFARFAATAALTTGATGGVIIVGGLAQRLFPLLPTATLVSAFHLPGPMQDWLRDVSICQVTDDDVALKGLAGMPI